MEFHTYIVNVQQHFCHKCGGALVSASYVLTAGHCVYKVRTRDITVVTGSFFRTSGNNKHNVSKILFNPLFYYGGPTYNGDYAIIGVSDYR